jgi:hypothetical protein
MGSSQHFNQKPVVLKSLPKPWLPLLNLYQGIHPSIHPDNSAENSISDAYVAEVCIQSRCRIVLSGLT